MKENLNQGLQNYKSAIPQVNGVKPWQDDSQIKAAFLVNTLNNLFIQAVFQFCAWKNTTITKANKHKKPRGWFSQLKHKTNAIET